MGKYFAEYMSSKLHQDGRLSPTEAIALARHSPGKSIIVEGKNDVGWYRNLERRELEGYAFSHVGGREAVLECFKVIKEKGIKNVVCVADRDLWTLYGVPEGLDGLVLTEGYSIENDVLKDSCVHRLFPVDLRHPLSDYVDVLSKWFAFQAEKNFNGGGAVGHEYPGITNVVDDTGTIVKLKDSTMRRIGYVEPDEVKVRAIRDDFEMKFRGKSLLQLYCRLLPEFGASAIMSVATKVLTTECQRRLIERIKSAAGVVNENANNL